MKLVDLILHEGDEWGDDNRHSVTQERGELVAQGFATAGG
jgi:hypothetical protein